MENPYCTAATSMEHPYRGCKPTRVPLSQHVSRAQMISLDDAPRGYAEFDAGASKKYVIDPHGMTGQL